MKSAALLILLGLVALHAAGASGAGLHIVVPAGPTMPVAKIAIECLQDYAAMPAGVIYGAANAPSTATIVIVLGAAGDSPELRRLWQERPAAKPDSYLINTVGRNPTTIVAFVNQATRLSGGAARPQAAWRDERFVIQ